MYDDLDSGATSMPEVRWKIERGARVWDPDEASARWELTPERLEMNGGKLLWSDAQRLTLLALLLENVGADAAVRLGGPEVWRAAMRDLR